MLREVWTKTLRDQRRALLAWSLALVLLVGMYAGFYPSFHGSNSYNDLITQMPKALRNLANRTGVDDIRALVAVLVQTDRFGTSVAQALRVHSDALRTERRQRAEEQAAKTTIKMVPVLVLFVFPSMFIVSIGPAAIQLIRILLPEIK